MIVMYYHRFKLVLKLLFLLFLIVFSLFSRAQNNVSDELFNALTETAKAQAQRDYVSPNNDSELWRNIDYTQYRAIRFDPARALALGQSSFEMQLFHRGFLYQQPVSIALLDERLEQQPVTFNPSLFIYEREAKALPQQLGDTQGFSGFRLHYPINRADYKDEFLVFQGASYFRLIGPGHKYGASFRGLAVNTATASGEEFPAFTSFYIKPHSNDYEVSIYALLNSPSLSGAYRFVVNVKDTAAMQVTARLFARESIEKLGIAPLTSMFLYGENQPFAGSDYRPEVHDSDGLLVLSQNGEAIWRALSNPKALQVTSQSPQEVAGFGLMQRDRDFANYLDGEAHYQARPGLWVTPLAGFGKGRVELVEIPTQSETHDNIVAYWVSDTPLAQGQQREFSYQLSAVDHAPVSRLAKVLRTRIGSNVLPGDKATSARRFVLDFALPENTPLNDVSLSIDTTQGTISESSVMKIEGQPLLRATFVLQPRDNVAHDMRAQLFSQHSPISEVWNYVYTTN